jgi:hypothetical protein
MGEKKIIGLRKIKQYNSYVILDIEWNISERKINDSILPKPVCPMVKQYMVKQYPLLGLFIPYRRLQLSCFFS